MDKLKPVSPLEADWKDGAAAQVRNTGIQVSENPNRRKLVYATDGSDAGLRAAVVSLGAPVPDGPNATTGDDPCCIWQAPNRWMIVYEKDSQLFDKLRKESEGLAATVIDVSDAWLSLDVSGSRANNMLTRGCEFDLHQRVFGKGRFAATQIARADVIIHARSSRDGYEILVNRTLAMDLWVWIKETARDLGE